MVRPPGFVDPQHPHHVCHLHKAIYGLKQAPPASFLRLTQFLEEHHFLGWAADTSFFIRKDDHIITIILIYVDDMIVTGNCFKTISRLISQMSIVFGMKELGNLTYFLGKKVSWSPKELLVCQTKYVIDLLRRARMEGSSLSKTQFLRNYKLSKYDGDILFSLAPILPSLLTKFVNLCISPQLHIGLWSNAYFDIWKGPSQQAFIFNEVLLHYCSKHLVMPIGPVILTIVVLR